MPSAFGDIVPRRQKGGRMKIQIKQSGGFAGIEMTLAAVDSGNLPDAAAAQLPARLNRLSGLCAQSPPSPGADRFQYEIEIRDPEAKPRTLTVIDEGDPGQPAMQEVIAILELLGARQDG